MKTERETTRIVRSWLEIGADRLPDRVLDSVLEQLPQHRQRRRPLLRQGRFSPMNPLAKTAIAAAAVLVVAVLGYNFLPRTGSVGISIPSPTPSPSPPAPSSSALVLNLKVVYTPSATGGSVKWAPNTLSAPADEAFQIAMKVPQELNGDTHNLWIVTPSQLETERAAIVDRTGEAIFRGGDSLEYGTKTYDIPALKAGTYYFVCTYYLASMQGTLTVP